MFTGIIECMGTVLSVEEDGSNRIYWISSPISDELKIDQSVAHDGVCLTVDGLRPGAHRVTAIAETLSKTSLGQWENAYRVNLERCMQMNGRIDGHMVQGHVDSTGTLRAKVDENGSWRLDFSFPPEFAPLLIEKGSVCINGTSLTAFNVEKERFSVALIPYTYEHTNLSNLLPGNLVNLEFDMVGKYINRILALRD